MKMFVYGLREYDERVYFDKFAALYGIEFDSVSSKPTLKT